MKETIMNKSAQFHAMLCAIVASGNVEVKYEDIDAFNAYCRFFSVTIHGGIMREHTQVFYTEMFR